MRRAPKKKAYHHGDLRRALVDASIAILHEEGAAALTLRSAARRVGVSHAAPKNHFGDVAGLLEAIAVVGFRGLTGAMQAARAEASEPLGRLVGIGEAYVRFATTSPGHFRAMFHPALGERVTDGDLDVASRETFGVLVSSMEEARAAGIVREVDVLEASLAAWTMVHGLSTLAVDRHLARKGFDRDPTALARTIAQQLFLGLRT